MTTATLIVEPKKGEILTFGIALNKLSFAENGVTSVTVPRGTLVDVSELLHSDCWLSFDGNMVPAGKPWYRLGTLHDSPAYKVETIRIHKLHIGGEWREVYTETVEEENTDDV